MGTPGSGRKRTPVKDRFSAEDEALSNIAREVRAEVQRGCSWMLGRQPFTGQLAVEYFRGTRHDAWPFTS